MGRTIDTPTEESVFEALSIPYVQPDRRNLDADGRPMWE
jgi:DNA polymerase/3'-5' exonuclease PolX